MNYMKLIAKLINHKVKREAELAQITREEILAEVKKHIDDTAREHRTDCPVINYDDPLCRLGYLMRHGAANAYLFEETLFNSTELSELIKAKSVENLSIASIGGGPGTEYLGLAKYLWRKKAQHGPPRKIEFRVLDAVDSWAETWDRLAKEIDDEIVSEFPDFALVVADKFLRIDVMNADSYNQYQEMFSETDIIVFNYIFSENKTTLDKARDVVKHLCCVAPAHCIFVVIDRLEVNTSFLNDVKSMFGEIFDKEITHSTIGGCIDFDESTDSFGDLLSHLGYPRLKFKNADGTPTVFWFTVSRG